MSTDPALQARHLAALRTGTAQLVMHVGDAEELLWNARAAHVVRRAHREGALRSEIHTLLDDAGLPLAWWQRCSGAPWSRPAWRLPYRVPHVTLHVIDGVAHDLGVEALIDELAQASGLTPAAYRRALLPASGLVPLVHPARGKGHWPLPAAVVPHADTTLSRVSL